MNFLKSLLAEKILPPIVDTVQREIRKQMDIYLPMIVEVIVRTLTEYMVKHAADVVDKATDLVPGQLDDQIIDPIARDIITRLGNLFGQFGKGV